MYCTKCGQMIEDSASFCPFCGESVVPGAGGNSSSFDSQSAASPFNGANPYDAPQPGGQYQAVGQGEVANSFLIPNILGTLLCCSPVFIVGLVFSVLSNNKAGVGDVQDANSKAQVAKICFWIGLGLGILQAIIFIVVMALGAVVPVE